MPVWGYLPAGLRGFSYRDIRVLLSEYEGIKYLTNISHFKTITRSSSTSCWYDGTANMNSLD